ncbi:alpha-galactosidase [Tessaracoccus sp. MC1627]|uniref:alpha-galactosidase n=1 Tax=Tessaracoccus sp. MC1627 TaxID=2760312 RepID=UPI0016010652|nr:alpha-galactosidase [Tessaracoccus sp. MC1627]MBB1513342.1 alpha-galactosidase [Tessaracoccus sp. MC1627]
MSHRVHAFVTLSAEGVGVVVDLTDGRLPALLHWGPELGSLTLDDATALALTAVMPVAPSMVDDPTRLSILPEHWAGWMGRPGLSGSRADGAAWSPRFVTHTLLIDGVETDAAAEQATLVELGHGSMTVLAADDVAGLELALTLELTPGGVLRSQARLTNTGDDDYRVDDLILAYPVPTVASELQDQAGRWAKERVPQRRAFTVGAHVREGRKGRTGADAATVLHAGVPGFGFAEGEVWGVHVGWSGNHTHIAERGFTGEQFIGGGELLLPGEVTLAPGAAYDSPWLYGSYGVGLDEVARRFHRYLRSRPQHPSSTRPVTINVWEAVYFDHSLQPLLELAEKAAAVGVERYVLDDGWFGGRRDDHAGLGDWVVSTDMWPDGLHPLVNRVKELGMQFGLWFEPEMVNEDSDVARAHPEWIMATGSRMPVETRFQQVINLGIPECYAYIRDQMLAILAEYDISYIKWDHNRDLIDAGTHPLGQAGVHAQTQAVYRLIDELKAAHPGLEIESCSSGGARVDLGILQRTDRVWVSDCIDPLERQQMMRWTQQLLPPEMLGSHIASGTSHTTGRTHELNFRAATAIFGHLGIEWDLRQASESELEELTEWVAFHKEHRSLLHGGDLVRLDFPDESLTATGVVAPDRSRAIYSYAAVSTHVTSLRGRLRMPGLDPKRRYRVSPALVGRVPSGLRPPSWWGVKRDMTTETVDLTHGRPPKLVPVADEAGVVLPGSVLSSAGLMEASVHPDHALIYLVEAVD